MKTTRVTAHSQMKGDCDVWLDTVQLKGKAKRKRSALPISKLLNPFTSGEGYNVSVALNFTQTKMEMPKTKQSSISNYFTCHRRVLNKMSTSGEENSASCATSNQEDLKCDLLCSDVDYKQRQPNHTEPDTAMWWDDGEESSRNIHSGYRKESSVDMSTPTTKRTLFQDFALCSSNIRAHKSSEAFRASENLCDFEPAFLSSLPNENTFHAFGTLNNEGRTSTQRPSIDLLPQIDKENIPKPPQKPLCVSHIHSQKHKKLASPQKEISDETDKQYEGVNSLFKWTKPNNSAVKTQKSQSHDDEIMGMLFTQDSQGFRVIAHRGLQAQSPLKDQSNISLGVPFQYDSKFLEEDEDEELFTQDSQGNMVIKH